MNTAFHVHRRPWPAPVVGAVTIVLVGLIAIQLARIVGTLLPGAPAAADLVNQSNDYQLLSVDGGKDDVVLMIDQRTESILVYHAMQTGLKFLGRRDIKDVFSQARIASGK